MSGYSGLTRQRVVAKAYSVTAIEFFDIQPNYFRVTNNGTGRLFFSSTSTPTAVNYDFTCDGSAVAMFCEPHARRFLYVFNPTGSDCAVDVMSFYAPFDPIALAFSALRLDFSGTSLETSTAITSFNTPLPSGSNTIGKVNVVDPELHAKCKSGTASSTAATYKATGVICAINFMSNDGEGDITLALTDRNGSSDTIIVKAGEVLNDISCNVSTIKVSGSGAYRLVYTEKAV